MRKLACVLFALSLTGCGSEPSHEDRGLSQWTKDLKAPGAPERKKAVLALGEIAKREPGTAPAVVTSLGDALKDTDPEVRRVAAAQLGRQGSASKALAPRLTEAVTDKDKDVRVAAIQALADVEPDNAQNLTTIMKALDDHEMDVKKSAVAALGSMGPAAKGAVPALQASLKKNDKDFDFKRMVNDAISSINTAR